MNKFVLLLAALLLGGCASGPRIDTSHPSRNHDSRIQYVVLHYTSADLERSLHLLTVGEVSSHYLIGAQPPTIYRLVDDSRRAWHAGDSEWQGRTWLNATSIGIELVNPGYRDTPEGRLWYPYDEGQIEALIELLKDVVKRNQIPPQNVIGHSDIAPLRKLDPGPLFPWKRLAEAGFGRWPDEQRVARLRPRFEQALPSITWFQQQLEKVGYAVPQNGELDVATRRAVAAFQLHYRPSRFDGQPDAETAALLGALVP
ncbi:N-acetylmuramoyl-L-alanine amidase [Zestomonas carbonaria]|uniref:N-acetylmuramoyl-L-alanine amidase n=1 Tax=Zestomonas carbonaria TaxID=2762745 RepID=A0A7U7EMY3_9GAMM|nr:N-acetylmuramoyl-L-alanine amidase [Pseudomonas carbonaria]CAD5107422.1 N-acetylmuramoyl-L-alanine amidase AmiD [Pseudomonas carbonaria]